MKNKAIIFAILLPLVWILSIKLAFLLPFQPSADFKWFIGGTIGTLLILLITYFFLRMDNASFSQMGLKWESKTPLRFVIGLLIGTAITLVMIGIIILFSDLSISRNQTANIPLALFWSLAFIPMAFMEEVAFRGLTFIKLNKLLGLRLTLLITSILFAYYHDASGATFAYQLLGPGIWGIIYGITAIWSDGLAVPTGLHVAANFIQAILGMKEEQYAIWSIDYNVEITETVQSHTSTIGLICQLLLLLFGIILTEWYLRNRKKYNSNVYYK